MTSAPDSPAAPDARPPVATVTWESVGVAIGFAITAATVISPWFLTPFLVLLGRTLVLAAVLLVAFIAAQRLSARVLPGWVPRWLPPTVAVALAAPLTTYLIYVFSLPGGTSSLWESEPHQWGFWITAGTALVLGLVVTLTAQLREREAAARSRELQFALERGRLERQALDARLAVLQAQIEPHFLFNTLANVQALVEAGSPRAAEVLKSLIAYLRAALPRLHAGAATLAQELSLVQAYLELMRMRMPDRLQFHLEADPALLLRPFPPMALLTLVENAIRHGIDPLEQGGSISVRATQGAGSWQVEVVDDGAGMDPRSQPGTGLVNLRERLQGAYGSGARLALEEAAPHGLRARIELPDVDERKDR